MRNEDEYKKHEVAVLRPVLYPRTQLLFAPGWLLHSNDTINMLGITAIVLAFTALGHTTPVSTSSPVDAAAIAPVDTNIGWHVPTAYVSSDNVNPY